MKSNSKINHSVKLRNTMSITLHTRIAQSLLKGSWRPGKWGLLQYLHQVNRLWVMAQGGDATAQARLNQLGDQIQQLRVQSQVLEKRYESQLNSLRGLSISVLHNPQPLTLPLPCAAPHTQSAALLLADFDYLVRQEQTLRRLQMNLLTGSCVQDFQAVRQRLSRLFGLQ